ncbi:MAG: hypothetical protein WDW36_005897 [Sanguina aurantia]
MLTAATVSSALMPAWQHCEAVEGSGLRDVSYPHVTVLLSAAEWVEEVMGPGSSTGAARGGPMGHGGSSSGGGMGGGGSGAGSGGGLRRLVGRVAHAHPDCSFSVLVVGLEKHLVTLERKGPDATFNQGTVWDAMASILINVPAGRFRWDLPSEMEAAQHIDVWSHALAKHMSKASEGYLKCFGEGRNSSLLAAMQLDMGGRSEATITFWKALCTLVDPGKAAAVANKYRSIGALLEAFHAPELRDNKARRSLLVGLAIPGSTMHTGASSADTIVEYFMGSDPHSEIRKGKSKTGRAAGS